MANSFDITKITNPTIKEMWNGLEEYLVDKYQHSGIYCWQIDGIVVYVGQSTNMLSRLYNHMREIEPVEGQKLRKTHKYDIMRQMKASQKHKISFDVLECCDEDMLDQRERELILKHRPVLNYQIPDGKGGVSGYNHNAKTITFEEMESWLENRRCQQQH